MVNVFPFIEHKETLILRQIVGLGWFGAFIQAEYCVRLLSVTY